MKAKLPGVNTVRKRLSSGGVGIYYYYRPTGARLTGKPGSAEFALSYAQAAAAPRANHISRTLAGLMNQYSHSQIFRKQLAESTQKEYIRKIKAIEKAFDLLSSVVDEVFPVDMPTVSMSHSILIAHRIEVLRLSAEIGRETKASIDSRNREAMLRETI